MAAEDPRTGDTADKTPETSGLASTETSDDGDANDIPKIDVLALSKRLGRYQLVMPLAQGGMGLVFAARSLGAHGVERLVAIKTLRPITSANDRAALLREARLTSRLHHRNIVATLDLGEVDDVPYVVMELVDGVSFSRLLAVMAERKLPLTVELATWIVMQAAHGLHAAHDLTDGEGAPLGLVHRDVSPQNILLSMSGEVKIADFGIAKFAGREESTATGMIKGKFGYMSPEQASAAEIDRRSDVFALGIVLWEALVRQKLFSTDTPARTILRVLEHAPKTPLELRPEVGEEISGIVMRCLDKDPAKRFDSAADLADALRSALRSRKAAVDEGDLAATIKQLFGDERRTMMDRLKNAPVITDGTATLPLSSGALPEETNEPPPEGSAVVAVSLSTPRPLRTRSSRTIGVALAVVAIGGGFVVWKTLFNGVERVENVTPSSGTALTSRSHETPPSPTAVASSSAASSPTLSLVPQTPITTPSSSSAPTESARSRPSIAPPSVIAAKPSIVAKPAPSTKPAVTTTTTTAGTATARPANGQPFESL